MKADAPFFLVEAHGRAPPHIRAKRVWREKRGWSGQRDGATKSRRLAKITQLNHCLHYIMKKQLYFISFGCALLGFSACLPALMESELRKDTRSASVISDLDGRFNRAANLHRYGNAPADWLADQRNQIYAGVATPVRLNVSERAVVTISTGTIRRDSVEKDLFYIESELSGISANISANKNPR